MNRSLILIIIGFWIMGALACEEKTPKALEKQHEGEKNPRKRAEIARDLMDLHLEELRSTISGGTMLEESSPALENYSTALDWLRTAVREAAHTGTSKSAEVLLRSHLRTLEDLKITVSARERPLLENLLTPMEEFREEILYSVMHPPEK